MSSIARPADRLRRPVKITEDRQGTLTKLPGTTNVNYSHAVSTVDSSTDQIAAEDKL